jgi:hypothetical protein
MITIWMKLAALTSPRQRVAIPSRIDVLNSREKTSLRGAKALIFSKVEEEMVSPLKD